MKEKIPIAARPPNELSEYLATMQAKSFPKLSSIELDDLRIPSMARFFSEKRIDLD
jgi:protein CMS1